MLRLLFYLIWFFYKSMSICRILFASEKFFSNLLRIGKGLSGLIYRSQAIEAKKYISMEFFSNSERIHLYYLEGDYIYII